MRIGIFTHYFPYRAAETARRIAAHGFATVQLNLEFDDWRFVPGATTAADCTALHDTFRRQGLAVSAIAAYVNPLAPDLARRAANLARLRAIVRHAPALGSSFVVTETGSFHPTDDWAPHPNNGAPAALDELVETIAPLVAFARDEGVALLVEPSVGTVVDTAAKARALLDAVDRAALGLVADPANLIDGSNLDRAAAVIDEFFALVGGAIRLGHAKDYRRVDGEARERHHHVTDPALYGGVEYPAPGLGALDYDRYLRHLALSAPAADLIIEHVHEADVARAKAFLDSRSRFGR